MLFNSLSFLAFFAAFVALYYATRGALRLWFTLLASYVFYAWWDWRFLALLGFSTVFEYVIALRLAALTEPRSRKRLLALSLTVNLALLAFFKYFHFFVDSARAAL